MKSFCKDCKDRDRKSDECALMPRRVEVSLYIAALSQRIDERGPMMPIDEIAMGHAYEMGSTSVQRQQAYEQEVAHCIEAHRAEAEASVTKIY